MAGGVEASSGWKCGWCPNPPPYFPPSGGPFTQISSADTTLRPLLSTLLTLALAVIASGGVGVAVSGGAVKGSGGGGGVWLSCNLLLLLLPAAAVVVAGTRVI